MPMLPLSKCSQPGCPNRTARAGPCDEHRRLVDRDTKSRQTWRIYKDRRWEPLRQEVLFEQPMCAGERCPQRSVVVDHIVPVRDRPELAFTRSNLQGLCVSCHNRKTAAENQFGGAHQ